LTIWSGCQHTQLPTRDILGSVVYITCTFRIHCNVWDIEVDQGGKTVTHVSGLPGVGVKDPDSAQDFGYTQDAQHAVTGACVEMDTEEEMEDKLQMHEGA
jgi:hypothetical protein